MSEQVQRHETSHDPATRARPSARSGGRWWRLVVRRAWTGARGFWKGQLLAGVVTLMVTAMLQWVTDSPIDLKTQVVLPLAAAAVAWVGAFLAHLGRALTSLHAELEADVVAAEAKRAGVEAQRDALQQALLDAVRARDEANEQLKRVSRAPARVASLSDRLREEVGLGAVLLDRLLADRLAHTDLGAASHWEREREWTTRVSAMLSRAGLVNAADEFAAEVPRSRLADAIGVRNERDRLARVLKARKERLEAIAARVRERERPPAERLREALSAAVRLRSSLQMWDALAHQHPQTAPPVLPPLDGDPLYRWARRTYDLLLDGFPDAADEFFGEDAALGPAHFAFAFTNQTRAPQGDRFDYLERRIALLRRLVAQRAAAPAAAA